MRRRPALTAALSACAGSLILASACGASTEPTDAQDSQDSSAGPISVTDSAGRTVELDGPAERVVTLEWQQTEDVLTLGVKPVGAADVTGYKTWDTAEELPADTVDVGMRGEPNMDALFSTDPDVVIVEVERGAPLIKQLEKYDVPVLVTSGADAKDPIGRMKATFTLIAEVLGKEAEAADTLADFDEALAEAKKEIAEADLDTTSFAYADAWLDGANISIRPFGQGSLVGELGEAIGLTNVWKGEVDPAYGLGGTDVEGIKAVGDAHFFYTSTESKSWIDALGKNAVWNNATFVTKDQLHAFPEGIWTFGGPESSEQVLDAFVEKLT